ncbi:hypothetical protein NL108_006379 [Boleophthalmus pectinirostris]|nr:hypothetical protein NL108_006379 [Boleophthalmus pectinirostris]
MGSPRFLPPSLSPSSSFSLSLSPPSFYLAHPLSFPFSPFFSLYFSFFSLFFLPFFHSLSSLLPIHSLSPTPSLIFLTVSLLFLLSLAHYLSLSFSNPLSRALLPSLFLSFPLPPLSPSLLFLDFYWEVPG